MLTVHTCKHQKVFVGEDLTDFSEVAQNVLQCKRIRVVFFAYKETYINFGDVLHMVELNASNIDFVTSAAWCNFILTIGSYKAFGMLFIEIQDRYGSSSSMTSLIASVLNGTYSVTGKACKIK
jgi:hypothetical protein